MPDHEKYQKARNKLIPHAERFANKKCGKEPVSNRDVWLLAWNMTFLDKMDELAREQGLNTGG